MDLEDGLAPFDIGSVDHDLSVETPGSKQGGVENVGAVGRRHHDDAAVPLEAIQLDEELVQCLLPLVVPTTETGSAMTADGVDLVDEHDGRGALLGLVEQVAH